MLRCLLLQDKVRKWTRMHGHMAMGWARRLLKNRMFACVARLSDYHGRLDSLHLDLASCQQHVQQLLLHRQHELEVDNARVCLHAHASTPASSCCLNSSCCLILAAPSMTTACHRLWLCVGGRKEGLHLLP